MAAVAAVAWLTPAAIAEEKSPAASIPASPPAPAATAPATSATPAGAAAATQPPPPPAGFIEAMDLFLDQTKQPVPWFRWGADIRFREEYNNNGGSGTLNKELHPHEVSVQRYRPRWWATATPVKDIDLNVRITWEGRHQSEPLIAHEYIQGAVLVDNANVKLTNVGGSPLTMTLGRQDIVLGDGWLVSDGTPNDGSRTYFFDAARIAYEFAPIKTTAEVIYIDQNSDGNRLVSPILNDIRGRPYTHVIEQDERGLILWVTNRSVRNLEINGYYMYKTSDAVLSNGDDGHIHTLGGRAKATLSENWEARAEGALQFGTRNGRELLAGGFNSAVTYFLRDKVNTQFRGQYEFLSGDDPDTPGRNEQFVPLWGRWPRLSELLPLVYQGLKESRQNELTNFHRLGFGWTATPCKPVDLTVDYNLLFTDENTFRARTKDFSEDGKFRGQLVRGIATVTFSKHLKGHILAEFFFPGNYYTDFRNDVATFLRGELFFTW